MRRGKTAAIGAAAVLAGVLVAGAQPAAGTARDGAAGSGSAGAGPERFERQRAVWHRCQDGPDDAAGKQLDEAGARCAEITVPLDYSRPDGRTVKIALSRLKAGDPRRRRGALLYNPGGPGVPAASLIVQLGRAAPEVAARYDLIGMDPRFVGRSTPLNCSWPVTGIGSAGPDRRSFDRTAALAEDLASRCAAHREVLPHASTRNTARDMDVIRSVLGEPKLSYLGSSYGTYLGAVYLQLFPGRADRVVFDSSLNPDLYGPDLMRTTGPAVTEVLKDWAAWAARRHDRYRLGSDAAEVLAVVNRIGRAAARRPLKVGRHRVDGRVLPMLLWNVTAGDDDEAYASFAADVRVLRDAARGVTVTPTPVLEGVLAGLPAPDADGYFSAQTAIQCADRAVSRDPETYYRDIRAHRADEPLFGPLTRNLTPCSFWPVAPAEPPTKIRNDVPVLMVGATGDPAATYPGQLAMHRALTGSRLVPLRGAFRHTVYGGLFAPRNACIDAIVDRYLTDGALPARGTACS
ncbi:alpha/beta hydrolase [Planomonospora venezuelensis]|uniref:Pimeloyl-ACP methyl ester carboxylesterase n=1 Tax=Planomonospora venezuelensis TaxID=1999 RepID=A0A841D6U1_PLAVE|nr:alpha/beta hydrolase [Planomonospora venezuelensis]MBB5964197.1 pimeloyl-ACP methyl ester carboxylesterase [Planomonospora venezuelensis]GIN04393.1 alpha/beta hydrolase [Planomonospora venezuelensis]